MSDLSAENGPNHYVTAHVIQELAGVADAALVTGDYQRCVAVVENIYNLLDRHTRSPSLGKPGDLPEAE